MPGQRLESAPLEVRMAEKLRAQLGAAFESHLASVVARTTGALEASGYASLLVHSGSPPYLFEDDQTYPFKVNAPFKLWAPLTDVPDCFVYFEPGRKPRMLFHHPRDYWHKPADLPDALWTRHFELHAVSDRASTRTLLPEDPTRP